jgi:hypothetical protein
MTDENIETDLPENQASVNKTQHSLEEIIKSRISVGFIQCPAYPEIISIM